MSAPDDGTDELDLVLRVSASHALKGTGGTEFIAWFQDAVPILAPRFAAGIAGGSEGQRAALHSLGRLLWNRMPLPDNRFRPRPFQNPSAMPHVPAAPDASTSIAAPGPRISGTRSST